MKNGKEKMKKESEMMMRRGNKEKGISISIRIG